MELKEVVVNELFVRKIQKATPCCLVCFDKEIPQKLFITYELKCGCKPYLHDDCVEQWFEIACRETCPNCGQKWEFADPCMDSFQKYLFICCSGWSFTVVISLMAIYLYQIATHTS